jgi:catechol 2,3-dioxygenase-like lactoylglutathione lyase family enzyme
MSRTGSLSALGDVMQLAYVPADFDAALKFWIETVGAGPFWLLEHVRLDELKHRGQATTIDFSLALGYWGDLQIELIRQHDDGPSIYKSWRDEGREGLHHVCVLVDDMAEARKVCAAAGAEVVQEAKVPGGGDVIYVDTGGGPGTMVEILTPAPGGRAFFDYMRETARGWDGSDPVRRLS